MRHRWLLPLGFGLSLLALTGGPTAARPRPAAAASSPIVGFHSRYRDLLRDDTRLVRVRRFEYRSHTGAVRAAYVVLPAWYGPLRHPAIPLVIAPHGRGVTARANLRLWGALPALGPFAVVSPSGQGRRLELYSWGDSGQIADLARMPELTRGAFPWLRIASHRIYAVGGSMGGQETLLLDATHPRLLAGAVSFDAPANLAARYRAFPELSNGSALQALARVELGGSPSARPDAYADRSPLDYARQLASSRVPLQIWWSTRDRIVVDQQLESGLLYRRIMRLNPQAPIKEVVGAWAHTAEMRPLRLLPVALAQFGLIRLDVGRSVGGRPIPALELTGEAPTKTVAVVGCIHGNECAGTAVARRLLELGPVPGARLVVLPNLNPDGAAAGTRGNAHGVDLNRNFPWHWQRLHGVYESGPRPLSEPESRFASRLLRRVRPRISIWFHQHLDLVDESGGDKRIEARYARLAGLPLRRLTRYPGSVASWENHRFAGSTAFVVELPAGSLSAGAADRYARAIRVIAS